MSLDSRSRAGAVVTGECEARILSWQGEEIGREEAFRNVLPVVIPAKAGSIHTKAGGVAPSWWLCRFTHSHRGYGSPPRARLWRARRGRHL